MVGNILKYIRICNNFRVRQVAEKRGVSAAYISAVELNKKGISLSNLFDLSDFYNIEASKILHLYELEKQGATRNEIIKEIIEYYIEKEKNSNKSL